MVFPVLEAGQSVFRLHDVSAQGQARGFHKERTQRLFLFLSLTFLVNSSGMSQDLHDFLQSGKFSRS